MSISYAGHLPALTLGRRSKVADRNTAHRNVTACLFCSLELSRTDHCLRHVKAKHSLDEVEELSHWDTVFNADPLHISARKVKRPDGDKIYDVGYCWDCHHWIPGRTVAQFQMHTCKMRKQYQRKTEVTAPPPPTIVPTGDEEDGEESVTEEDKVENEKWDDARREIYYICKDNTAKWPSEEKQKLMAIIHAAMQDSEPMLGFRQAIVGLLNTARPAASPPAPPAPPAPVATPPPVTTPASVSNPTVSSTATKPFFNRQVLAAPGGRELR